MDREGDGKGRGEANRWTERGGRKPPCKVDNPSLRVSIESKLKYVVALVVAISLKIEDKENTSSLSTEIGRFK